MDPDTLAKFPSVNPGLPTLETTLSQQKFDIKSQDCTQQQQEPETGNSNEKVTQRTESAQSNTSSTGSENTHF